MHTRACPTHRKIMHKAAEACGGDGGGLHVLRLEDCWSILWWLIHLEELVTVSRFFWPTPEGVKTFPMAATQCRACLWLLYKNVSGQRSQICTAMPPRARKISPLAIQTSTFLTGIGRQFKKKEPQHEGRGEKAVRPFQSNCITCGTSNVCQFCLADLRWLRFNHVYSILCAWFHCCFVCLSVGRSVGRSVGWLSMMLSTSVMSQALLC